MVDHFYDHESNYEILCASSNANGITLKRWIGGNIELKKVWFLLIYLLLVRC